jgi:16S rRNA G527 N7-methylase RsmG
MAGDAMGKVTREAEENATKYFKAMMAINGKMNLTGHAVIKNIDNGSKVINRGNFLFSGI